MDYQIPTTKEDLHVTLKDIYYYYRLRRKTIDVEDLSKLTLQRLDYVVPNQNQLIEYATKQLLNAHCREYDEQKYQLNKEIVVVTSKLSALEFSHQNKLNGLEKSRENNRKAVQDAFSKQQTYFSDMMLDKLLQLDGEVDEKVQLETQNYLMQKAQLEGELQSLIARLDALDSDLDGYHQKEIIAKANQLENEQRKVEREVFKYNNSLDEKEQRYSNSIQQVIANLSLKIMELQNKEFTKEQLVDMGYYKDVIDCTRAYYDTLDVVVAYNEILEDTNVMLYLDDYYESVVYQYKLKAMDAVYE